LLQLQKILVRSLSNLSSEFNNRFNHQLKIKQIRIYETPNNLADALQI